MAQLMPLPLTVSWFSKIQIAFTFLVTAHSGSPGKSAVKWVRVDTPALRSQYVSPCKISSKNRSNGCSDMAISRFSKWRRPPSWIFEIHIF